MTEEPRDDRSPNVVLIVTDQQRFDTIAALGHVGPITPTIDQLVREGVAFTRAYVTSPSCTPSRASLFTGLYPHTSGVWRNNDRWTRSWVEQLAAAGYRCVNVGKMHTFPYDASAGFHERHVVENKDRSNPTLPFLLDEWDKALWSAGVEKPDRRVHRRREDYRDRLGAFVWEGPEHLHADNFVGGLARHWLDVYPGDEPFFLQIGFPGPHPPYDPTPRHLAAFEDREVGLAERDAEDVASLPAPLDILRLDHEANDRDGIVHRSDATLAERLEQRRHYLANVAMIDEQIQGVIEALERRGALRNTVIVFTSDHGDALGDHGLSQKWSMYEPSVRVPMVFWGPGRVREGVVVDGVVSMMDIGPTILELCGLEVPPYMEATSVLAALQGGSWSSREYAFSEHARDAIFTGSDLMTMVTDGTWKLVCFVDSDEGQLFDLATDPDELHNLWGDPVRADVRERLLEAVTRWRAESSLRTADWKAPSR